MKRRAYLLLAVVAILLAVSIIHSVGRIAASVDPNNLLARGHAYYDANDLERAVSSYKEAIRLDPACTYAYDWLSQCYRDMGRHAESLDTWRQARTNLPEWGWARVRLAFDYDELGMYEQAIAEWKQLIEREPDIAGLNALLADVYLKTSQYEEAIAACKNALRLKPDHPKSHYNLGRAYLQMGNKDLVLQEYEVLNGLDKGLADELLACVNR